MYQQRWLGPFLVHYLCPAPLHRWRKPSPARGIWSAPPTARTHRSSSVLPSRRLLAPVCTKFLEKLHVIWHAKPMQSMEVDGSAATADPMSNRLDLHLVKSLHGTGIHTFRLISHSIITTRLRNSHFHSLHKRTHRPRVASIVVSVGQLISELFRR